MINSLLFASIILWLIAATLGAFRRISLAARGALVLGCVAAVAAAIQALPHGSSKVALPGGLFGEAIHFHLSTDAAWLFGFGCVGATLACALASPCREGSNGWLFGAALSLIGALGVFGLQDGVAFLIAWELMSFGGAIMILNEKLSPDFGRSTLFMLSLLEVGAVALLLAIMILAVYAGHTDFAYAKSAPHLSTAMGLFVGLLLLIGFGAKLGLLPFFEWFPNAYGSASGASGALLSGVILNAAYFGLGRGLLDWLPAFDRGLSTSLGIIVTIVAVVSAILTALYAFQEEDWRSLLSFSSAENASVAVAMLGTALIFQGDAKPDLAGLAWLVALLHLAGHSLAKGGLFLAADAVYRSTGNYLIAHTDLLRRSGFVFGLGALFAAMSLAAMPPQAGFVSEWFVFQTVFQGFHLSGLGERLTMALAGAGLALTAAVALATFIKVFGIGLLGRTARAIHCVSHGNAYAVGLLGLAVLLFAVTLPAFLSVLSESSISHFGNDASRSMIVGPVLVPLTAKFAFISPTLLVVVMPILALLPIAVVVLSKRRKIRVVPVWYGGLQHDPDRVSTTALTFSNAMRTFYSFVYRPVAYTEREVSGPRYFIRRLIFTHDVAPIFGPFLFRPATQLVNAIAKRFRSLQSGSLNFYLSLIGVLLVLILAIALVRP